MADIVSRGAYGSGSMYQRTSDWRWLATLEGGYTTNGGRRRITVTGPGCEDGCSPRCHHRAAIKRKLRDKRNDVERDGRQNTKRTTSVARWSVSWLAAIQPHVRPAAYATDKAAVRSVVAAIGEVKLSDLTPEDIRSVAGHLRSRGKSSSTALRYHGSLMRMLKSASLEGYNVPPNVLLGEKPKAAVHDRMPLLPHEAVAALAAIRDQPDRSRWALAMLQGLRQAEALGLTWDAVDLGRQTLTISWQAKSLRYLDKTHPELGFEMPDGYEARHIVGATHLVRPKSKAGWRVIPLVPWAATALEQWQQHGPLEPRANPLGLVWPGRIRDGKRWPRNPASDRTSWDAIQKVAKIHHPTRRDNGGEPAPYEVHEIRHGVATLLMELGVPESVRTAIMGHSSMNATRGYEHVDLNLARVALSKVAGRLGLD